MVMNNTKLTSVKILKIFHSMFVELKYYSTFVEY